MPARAASRSKDALKRRGTSAPALGPLRKVENGGSAAVTVLAGGQRYTIPASGWAYVYQAHLAAVLAHGDLALANGVGK